MNKRFGLLLGLALAVVVGFTATPVLADSLKSASDKMTTIAKDQVVEGTAYLGGDTVVVDGNVNGDIFCAGRDVTISGTVEGDVLCGAQNITIDGIVKGDVRVAGAKIFIKGTVEGSATLTGMDITTDSASMIGEDATIMGAQISLYGAVGRDAMLGAENVALRGQIGRNVEGGMTRLSISDEVKIGGNLSYASDIETKVPEGAVAGKVQRSEAWGKSQEQTSTNSLIMGSLLMIASFVVLTVLLALVIPKYIHRVSDINGPAGFAKMFLVGLVAFVLVPIVMLMLSMTVVGLYAALVVGMAMLMAVLIGGSLVAFRVGRFMFADKYNAVLSAAVGALVLAVLGVIPYVGWVIILISIMVGVGMVIMGLKDQYTPRKAASSPVKLADSKKVVAEKKSTKR